MRGEISNFVTPFSAKYGHVQHNTQAKAFLRDVRQPEVNSIPFEEAMKLPKICIA